MGAVNKQMITPIFGHDTDDDQKADGNEEKAESKSNEDDIPQRPSGHRQEAPRRQNNAGTHFEFYIFGLGIHSVIEALGTMMQGNSDTQYASEQEKFNDLCSKGIIVFLLILICGIIIGMI